MGKRNIIKWTYAVEYAAGSFFLPRQQENCGIEGSCKCNSISGILENLHWGKVLSVHCRRLILVLDIPNKDNPWETAFVWVVKLDNKKVCFLFLSWQRVQLKNFSLFLPKGWFKETILFNGPTRRSLGIHYLVESLRGTWKKTECKKF